MGLLQNEDGTVKYAKMITQGLPLNQTDKQLPVAPTQWQMLSGDGEILLSGATHRLGVSITTYALFTQHEYNIRRATNIKGVKFVYVLNEHLVWEHLQGNVFGVIYPNRSPARSLAKCYWIEGMFYAWPSNNTP